MQLYGGKHPMASGRENAWFQMHPQVTRPLEALRPLDPHWRFEDGFQTLSALGKLVEHQLAPAQFFRLGAEVSEMANCAATLRPSQSHSGCAGTSQRFSDARCRTALNPKADEGNSTCQSTLESRLEHSSPTLWLRRQVLARQSCPSGSSA